LANKEREECWVENYSTVTEFVHTTEFNSKNSINNNVESILLKFELDIRTSKLTKTSHYNSYQHKLYRLIKYLKEVKGIGYRRISHILFDKGYRSIRTNSILRNNYIYSIYKKGKIRENRIYRSFDTEIHNVRIYPKYISKNSIEKTQF